MTTCILFVLFSITATLGSLLLALPALPADRQSLTLNFEETITRPSKKATRSAIAYVISPDRTVIRRHSEETIIDYCGLALIRSRSGSSVRYPLNPPTTSQEQLAPLSDGLMRRVAAYRLAKPGAGLVIRGMPTVERSIWFGPGPSLSLVAKPLTVEYFGQTFGERRLQCWVSQSVANYATMAAIVRDRRAVVRANPLLLQIDPTNLILPLDGLPIRIQEYRDAALYRLELLAL